MGVSVLNIFSDVVSKERSYPFQGFGDESKCHLRHYIVHALGNDHNYEDETQVNCQVLVNLETGHCLAHETFVETLVMNLGLYHFSHFDPIVSFLVHAVTRKRLAVCGGLNVADFQ